MAIKFHVFFAFMVISTTSLLPWNLFMNAHEYFFYKLRDVNENVTTSSVSDPTPLQRSYEGWVTVTGGLSCLIGSAVNFVTTDRLSNSFRVICGHILVICSLVPTVLFTFVNTDQMQTLFFWLSMLLASVAGFGSTGLIGCGLLGYSARFPAEYMQAVMLGQSFAGILSSVLSIFCEAFTSNSLSDGRVFFCIATGWSLLSVVVYVWLIRSSITKIIMTIEENERSNVNDIQAVSNDQTRSLLNSVDDFIEDSQINSFDGDSLRLRPPIDEGITLSENVKRILSLTRNEMISGYCVLFVTLLAFPAVSSMVQSTKREGIWKLYFSAIACFLLFNVGDAIGRLLFRILPFKGRALLLLSLLRFLLLPLIFFCNVHPRFHSTTLFHSDTIFVILISLLAVSNGLLFTSANVSATRKVDEDLRELTGSLMGLIAVISSVIGSIFGALIALSV